MSDEHRRQKGFTLVELLVVMAVVAVLAGILLPVLAQAQVAAKRTGSLSNLKQISLASHMYAIDSDDQLPLLANGNPSEIGWTNSKVLSWVGETQPYLKTLGVLIDPLMGDPHGIFAKRSEVTTADQNAYPDYGLNYAFLAPWEKDPVSFACSRASSVSISGAAHPSTTIQFTTTYEPNLGSNNVPSGGYSDYGDWMVTAPGARSIFGSSVTRCISPGMDWSQNPGSFNSGKPFTAEASQRYGGGSVCSMLDGHAKYLKAGQAAAGTDWETSTYLHTRVIDASKYLWSYADTP